MASRAMDVCALTLSRAAWVRWARVVEEGGQEWVSTQRGGDAAQARQSVGHALELLFRDGRVRVLGSGQRAVALVRKQGFVPPRHARRRARG